MTPNPPDPRPPESAAAEAGAVGAIATFDVVVLDTPKPRRLAEFYCRLLSWRIVREDDDWVTIQGNSDVRMAFQLAPNLIPPTWPDGTIPQQFHIDVTVPDLDAGEQQVLAIGARLTGQPERPSDFRAYLDPSGHPFCLCLDSA